jgi:hypothetical protein
MKKNRYVLNVTKTAWSANTKAIFVPNVNPIDILTITSVTLDAKIISF